MSLLESDWSDMANVGIASFGVAIAGADVRHICSERGSLIQSVEEPDGRSRKAKLIGRVSVDVMAIATARVLPFLEPDTLATLQHTPRVDMPPPTLCGATLRSLPATQGQRSKDREERARISC